MFETTVIRTMDKKELRFYFPNKFVLLRITAFDNDICFFFFTENQGRP